MPTNNAFEDDDDEVPDRLDIQYAEDKKVVRDALARLAEHFDTIHIFVTRYDGTTGNTMNANEGTGNYFAREGQIKAFVADRDELTRINRRIQGA